MICGQPADYEEIMLPGTVKTQYFLCDACRAVHPLRDNFQPTTINKISGVVKVCMQELTERRTSIGQDPKTGIVYLGSSPANILAENPDHCLGCRIYGAPQLYSGEFFHVQQGCLFSCSNYPHRYTFTPNGEGYAPDWAECRRALAGELLQLLSWNKEKDYNTHHNQDLLAEWLRKNLEQILPSLKI